MLRNPFATFENQNYQAYNRGDMFVPKGSVSTPINVANKATPRMGPMYAHAMPVTYSQPFVQSRLHGNIGMITPTGSGAVK